MKKDVLKCAVLAVMALVPTMLHAQLNPKQGFIITQQNDTVYGTIDYLSDKKCAYECRFKADGDTEYKVYKPGDINAFRFTNNGVFYVTKTLPVEGQQKTFFAEFLLQGGVCLLHHKEFGSDYYYFIDEDGQVASVKNDNEAGSNYNPLQESAIVKRAKLKEALMLLSKSEKAQNELWTKDITSENLTSIVRDYDMEYCTSSGDCVQFRYSEKASRNVVAKIRFQAGLGICTNNLKAAEDAYQSEDFSMTKVVPQLGIGADLLLPRSSNNWSLQVLGLVSRWSSSKEIVYYSREFPTKTCELKYIDLELQLGVVYSFKPQSKYSPVLRGGLVAEKPVDCTRKNLNLYEVYKKDIVSVGYGFYLGAGVDLPIQHHLLRLAAEYKWANFKNSGLSISYLAINAGVRI